MTLDAWLWRALLVYGLMFGLWLVSVYKRDVSIVDPYWSICFLLVTAHAYAQSAQALSNAWVLIWVALWSLRLWLFLSLRSRGKPEDPRYTAFRERFGPERYGWLSLFQVFLLQGTLALLISLPLQVAAQSARPQLSSLDILGTGVVVIGLLLEAVADDQLRRFRNNPQNRGKVLDTGLWRYSRHPNYFGESVLWLGFGLWASDDALFPYTWLGPLLMWFLLLRVSGVTLLDAHLEQRKPDYAAYIQKTSAFFPWPPRRTDT